MLCNLTTTPRSNDLNSPPLLPAGFAVERPTQQELQLRKTISIARGVRTIESAWPGQSPRQAYPPMSGRGSFNARRGGGDPARDPNNRVTNYLGSSSNDDSPLNQSGSSPGPGGQTLATRAGNGREVPPRIMPLLLSLPTADERIAAQQARDQENRNAKLEKKRNKQLNRNSCHLEAGPASAPTNHTEPTRHTESTGPLDHAGSMAGTSNNPFVPPRGPQQPIFMNKDWMNLPEIPVRVGPDLPMQYTTWDMYNLFREYGEIESVELFENSSGTRNGFGRVRFRYNSHSLRISRSIFCILDRKSLNSFRKRKVLNLDIVVLSNRSGKAVLSRIRGITQFAKLG